MTTLTKKDEAESEGAARGPLVAKIGDWIQDCDPRIPDRVGTIVDVFPNGYEVKWNTGKLTTVLAHRVHDKPIRTGYRLLRGNAPEAPKEAVAEAPHGK